MRLQNSTAVSRVSGDVCSPLMISTPFCTGTGFIKCVLTTRDAAATSVGLSGGVVAAAILVMDMEEVLVARMACGGAILASWEKMSVFKEGISGTASITKSTLERSSSLVVGESRERAESASDWEIRFLDTSFSKSLSRSSVSIAHQYTYLSVNKYLQTASLCLVMLAKYRPKSLALPHSVLPPVRYLAPDLLESASTLRLRSRYPLNLPTICPAPITPNRLTSAAAGRLELVLKERRLAPLARLAICRPAMKEVDIFKIEDMFRSLFGGSDET